MVVEEHKSESSGDRVQKLRALENKPGKREAERENKLPMLGSDPGLGSLMAMVQCESRKNSLFFSLQP